MILRKWWEQWGEKPVGNDGLQKMISCLFCGFSIDRIIQTPLESHHICWWGILPTSYQSRALWWIFTQCFFYWAMNLGICTFRGPCHQLWGPTYMKKSKKNTVKPKYVGPSIGIKKIYTGIYIYIIYYYIYITSIYIYSRGPFSGAFADQISYYETSWTWWDGPGTWQLGIDKDIYEYWGIAWCIVYLRVSKQMSLHLICLI